MAEANPTEVEVWRPVVGREQWYSVSNLGRVRRDYGGKRFHPKLLKVKTNNRHYPFVQFVHPNRTSLLVHRIMMAAFVGPCPDGKEVNHISGIKTDNRIENLEYVTHQENMEHAARMQLRTGRKLTGDQVREICQRRYDGELCKDIAARFGVHKGVVSKITCGKGWKHLGATKGFEPYRNNFGPGKDQPMPGR